MRNRWFVAAAGWTLAYLGMYLAVIQAGGGPPAAWYLLLLVAAVVLATWAGVQPRLPVAVGALIILVGAALVALASIGMFLLPAVALAAVGLSRRGGTPSRSPAGSPGEATSGTATPGPGSP